MRMTAERWQKISEVFQLARAQNPAQRDAFLRDICAADLSLRREVESLMSAHDRAGQFGDSPVSVQASPLQPGTLLGPYRIGALLGSGGMGEVYRAHDTRLERIVALKVLAAHVNADPQFRERFRREARAIAALNHPNICTLHDVGDDFLVMELVDGESLREWLGRGLPRERSLEIGRQVLEALGAAHRTGVVHRDLKPENVMVRRDGYVKVLDFGLATWLPTTRGLDTQQPSTLRATRAGEILGTVAYMSPEQITGEGADQRSDLFAFGILLYEMLTGRHPWPRSSAVDTLHAILHDDPPPLGSTVLADTQVAIVVRTLLRKHPPERYQSAEAALEALATPAVTRGSASADEASPKPLTSIAVLPFVFLSDVDDNRALSLGFADALITIFANLEDVAVTPTSAILNYAAGTEPSRACRDLGVRYSLQGTVQKLGARWRVSIQLFDATTQKVMLSEKHDFTLESVFAVQDEIGRRTVESLQRRFPSDVPQSRDRYSSDPEAYNDFMAGLRDSSSGREDILRSAAEHLSNAIQRDPDFALARATLSFVSMNMHYEFDSQHAWLQQAEDQCSRALALDPTLPEGHLARAWILWSPAKNFQHADAIAALEQVLIARPNFERAHNRMSSICLHIGRLEEARIAHEHAQRTNPETRTGNLEWFYLMSGDFAAAEDATAAWLRDRPDNLYARMTHILPALWSGDLTLAEDRLATVVTQLPDEPLMFGIQGLLHARRGQADLALQSVRKALESPRSFGHTHHTYHYIAGVYAVLGETDKAMGWLERSVDTGWACWPFFRIDPHLENLREETRFKELMANLEQTYTALEIRRL